MDKFPLDKLLILINTLSQNRAFNTGMVRLLINGLSPIETTSLGNYKKLPVREHQRNYLVMATADILQVNYSQLIQYWNDVSKGVK